MKFEKAKKKFKKIKKSFAHLVKFKHRGLEFGPSITLCVIHYLKFITLLHKYTLFGKGLK